MSRIPASALGVDSNHDDDTKPAHDYRNTYVYPYLNIQGYTVETCQGAQAHRTYVQPKAQQPGVAYITGSGHGTQSSFRGISNNAIFAYGSGVTTPECAGRIIHLLSCEAAVTLGPHVVGKGCLAYFGYDQDYLWEGMTEADVNFFFECDSEIDRAFADGLTAEDVYDRVKDLFLQRAADFRADATDDNDKWRYAAILDDNFSRLRCPSSPVSPLGFPLNVPQNFGNPLAKLP